MVSRAIKGDKAGRAVEIVKEVSRNNFKIPGFEVHAPLYNSLLEEESATIDQKAIIVFSVDGANWNEYESITRGLDNIRTAVIYGGTEVYSSTQILELLVDETDSKTL